MDDFLTSLAPGVIGYTVDRGELGLYVPLIEAERPGQGDVGRYLDSLPRDRRVVVPNVISSRLSGMLERRGFSVVFEWAPEFGESVECWERQPLGDPKSPDPSWSTDADGYVRAPLVNEGAK